MLESLSSGYLAELASDLTIGVLNTVGRRIREHIVGTPREQALIRCYQAASAALLPENDPHRQTYLPILQDFFAQPVAQVAMAELVRGNSPDQARLLEAFEDTTYGRDLPPFDFSARLAAAVEAFLQAAEQESVLIDTIQTAQLRDATATLRSMAVDLSAIRQALTQVGYKSISAAGDIQAENVVTGLQVNHIVNNYQVSGGMWGETEYRTALDRYLQWVSAANGHVILRGIKRGGQQAVDLPLHEVYVPLAAETLPEPRQALKQGLMRAGKAEPTAESGLSAKTERITMRELLSQGNYLTVIGAPGCGKTTVLQHIAWTLAEALRTGQVALAEKGLGLMGELPLPIYVPLSLYARHRRRFATDPDPRRRQLATFITHYLLERQAGLNLPDDFFGTLLNQGRHIILLLDGLDEVPDEDERALVSQAVADLTHGRDQAHFVVTSRSHAYQGRSVLGADFRTVRVLPLETEQVNDLIRRAYQAIFPAEVEKDERDRRATDLMDGVADLERERAARLGEAEETRLVSTPLMVRMLLIVHFNLRRLPDQRAELYMAMIDTLLTSGYNPDEAVAQYLAKLGGDWRARRNMLQHLAFHMHSQGQAIGREIDEGALINLLRTYQVEHQHKPAAGADELVADFIANSRQRGGLLEERAGSYRFSHLSLQEFLTARALAEVERDVKRITTFILAEDRALDAWWREPVLLTIGYLNITATDSATALIHCLANLDKAEPPQTALALAATELAATAFLDWGGAEATQTALARRLVSLLTDPDITTASPAMRATAGRALGRLGDPRPGIGLMAAAGEESLTLPDIAWCEVPAGPFLLGANDDEADAYDDERPQHRLTLPTFYISRYPITNAQFAPFIEAGGYDEARWWTEAGWAWRNGAEPELSQISNEELRKLYTDHLAQRPGDRRHEPFWWHDERLNLPDQPVVGLNWYEALAYTTWLADRLKQRAKGLSTKADPGDSDLSPEVWSGLAKGEWVLRLPTETEWEKSAGWDPAAQRKRVYSWGDEWDETKANVDRQDGLPMPVGLFPLDRSPCGVMDMTGNVADWTLSAWGGFDLYEPGFRYPFTDPRPQMGLGEREGVETPGFRTLRGGAWVNSPRYARVSARSFNHPDFFTSTIGVRLVVAPV